MYFDSCVSDNISDDTRYRILSTLQYYGYRYCGFDRLYDGKLSNLKTEGLPPRGDVFSCKKVLENRDEVKVFHRLTLLLKDKNQLVSNARLTGEVQTALSNFDVFAVRPTTEQMFQHTCTSLECDIISLDFSKRLPFPLRMIPIRTAIQRGVFFEICYTPVIANENARRNVLSNSMILTRICSKGNGLILSSGALSADFLRSPHDVANIASVWGLTWENARRTVSANCVQMLKRAYSRFSARSVIRSVALADAPQWEIDLLKSNNGYDGDDGDGDGDDMETDEKT